MRISKYSHDQHYLTLRKWLKARDIVAPTRDLFSDCGFCVDDKAIGFLFKTNSKQCYIDHVAADPEAKSEDRNKAMSLLFELLIREAKECGFKLITGITQVPVLKERVAKLGFIPHGEYTLYYKVI